MTPVTAEGLQQLLQSLGTMSPAEMVQTIALLDELDARKRQSLAQMDFLAFIAAVDPVYKFGTHLKRLGTLLMQLEMGEKPRIAVSMAPRHGKSLMISIYFPAWYIGKHPEHKLIIASHTGDLAVDMARKVRNLMQTPIYKSIFPGVAIAADAKAAGKWNTTKGGEVFAAGTGGALAGRGGHLCCTPATKVITRERGVAEAQSVAVGEHLRSWHGWAEVTHRITPSHAATVTIAGRLNVSLAHPVWTFNRGWVPAGDVRPNDLLWAMTLFEVVKAHLLRSSYGTGARYLARGGAQDAKAEPRETTYSPVPAGGVRGVGIWLFGGRSKGVGRSRLRESQESLVGGFVTFRRWAGNLSGLFLGVRFAGPSAVEHHAPRQFVNFTVAGDNTFVGDTIMLHNCIIDDPISEQDVKAGNTGSLDTVYEWFRAGLRTRLMPEGKIAILHCLTGDMSVALADGGEKPLRDIRPEDQVVSYVAGEFRSAKVLGWANQGVDNVYALLLHSGVILRGNERHPFLVSDDGVEKWVTIKNLRPGMRLVSTKDAQTPRTVKPLRTLSTTLDEIVSITPDGEEEVFDIQVEGTENFLANGVVSHNTRWSARDLIGRVVKDSAMNPEADQYEVFEFPAVLTTANPAADPENESYDPEAPKEVQKALWPEQWSLESLLRTKESMPAWQWNAQYQQNPTARESAIIKKDHIRWWPENTPPKVDFIVQGWDTAMTTKERSDFSVCQTWGVWKNDDGVDNVILLNRVKGKYEFPELKRIAHEQAKEWEPDSLIVETKASGQPLVDELRRSGVFVQEFSPGKGQDKIARLNAVSDMFASGQVWVPETHWASEVVAELLAFPAGEHDDEVDCATLCLARVRKGGLLRLSSDHDTMDDILSLPRRTAYY